jgi:hypothetical protein
MELAVRRLYLVHLLGKPVIQTTPEEIEIKNVIKYHPLNKT